MASSITPKRGLSLSQSGALFGCVFVFAGCAIFSGKPPLPKHASIEPLGRGAAATDYAAAVASADIIYFPEDRVASAGRSEPAALLLEAFVQSGQPFAIGWDQIDAMQQSALDELTMAPAGGREAVLARIELKGTGRAREHCRSVMRDVGKTAISHLALRCPATLAAKFGTADRLTPQEEGIFPRGFRSPAGGFEAYAAQYANRPGPTEGDLGGSYRLAMLRQQFAAETIVRFFQSGGSDRKLLVFLTAEDLESGRGVPFYVAQKLQKRQLVFGAETPEPLRSKLLTQASAF